MAASPQKVSRFFLDLTMGRPDSIWTFKAGPKKSPDAYCVPADLSMTEFYALFEEIATKIVQAQKAGSDFISVMVDNGQIERDKKFVLDSDILSDILKHLAAATKSLNAARRLVKE